MHFYTTDAAEVSNAIKNGASHLEQVACYVNNTQVSCTIPLQRLYNKNSGYHFYTANPNEALAAIDVTFTFIVIRKIIL